MNKLEFSEQMARMTESFGEKTYTQSRTDLIWKMVQDMEPGDFRRVVDHFIRSSRNPPLPSDFDNATIPYRRKMIPEGETTPDCSICLDVGFIRVRYHGDTAMASATLMRCPCSRGKRHPHLFIPTWERGLEQAFTWAPCPVEWFKPKEFDPGPEGVTLESLKSILDNWMGRLKSAHQHWTNLSRKETGS